MSVFGKSGAFEATLRENETLKAENARLRAEIERLKGSEYEASFGAEILATAARSFPSQYAFMTWLRAEVSRISPGAWNG